MVMRFIFVLVLIQYFLFDLLLFELFSIKILIILTSMSFSGRIDGVSRWLGRRDKASSESQCGGNEKGRQVVAARQNDRVKQK